jgi:hypothetical protein
LQRQCQCCCVLYEQQRLHIALYSNTHSPGCLVSVPSLYCQVVASSIGHAAASGDNGSALSMVCGGIPNPFFVEACCMC